MSQRVETHAFQTETSQMLDLMVHSIYSHKEIFLRELISNASDAMDKLRFESVQKPDLSRFTEDPHIRLEVDADAKTLTVHDTGIGMTRDDVLNYIGTIAKSGSREYLDLLKQARKQEDLPPELIGQFGVGFYSSFMVADKVLLVTRHATEEKAWRWESTGEGSFTLEETERDRPGTSVTLFLKDADEEDGLEDFTKEWTLRSTVKKYSDFVAYPIRMEVERTEVERDEKGQPKEGAEEKKVVKDETLNSMKAIWVRPENEVTEEEYAEFYKHISHDWNEPLQRIRFTAEGRSEFRALLFIPSRAPFDLFMQDGTNHGVHLYIKRVFIMQDCKELLPSYLRFIKGVVDSEDLSLNISREILQQNRLIQFIRNGLVRKVFDALSSMAKDEPETYKKFWDEFGRVLKEGVFQDQKNREKILDLCRFDSTHAADEQTSLQDYIGRMQEGQDTIYYLTGSSRKELEASPHLEALKAKGYEVLLLTEPVDEVWVQSVFEYQEKKMQSIGKGEVELGSEEERKQAEEERQEKQKTYASLLEFLQQKLDDDVKEVRLSNRLTSSPCCMVGDVQDLSPQLVEMLRASGQDIPEQKRILEINPDHALIEKMHLLFEKDKHDAALAQAAVVLEGLALIAEGQKPKDAQKFNGALSELMLKAI